MLHRHNLGGCLTKSSPVLHALTDPTRRAVLERLTRGPAAVSELAQPFKMALPSFVQHLGVLENCGLVRSKKKGACAPAPWRRSR
jgi:DNA-binding transcriptional ArsR family regulator